MIIDNLGGPLVPTSHPYLYLGQFGNTIDIRSGVGTFGAPLVILNSSINIGKYLKRIETLNQILNDI